MDYDGGSDYSPVRSIFLENIKPGLKIYPNPTSSYIHINLENNWEGEMNLRMVNAFGQVVFFENMEKYGDAGNWQIDMSDVAPGVYHVSISYGGNIMERRVVKR